jgi:hypothetical protein
MEVVRLAYNIPLALIGCDAVTDVAKPCAPVSNKFKFHIYIDNGCNTRTGIFNI